MSGEKGQDIKMSGTEVLTGNMMDIAAGMDELIGRYRHSINRVYVIGQELDSMWEGNASSKFTTQMSNDRERFDAMAKLLESYVSVLRDNASIYLKAEDAVLSVLNTCRSGG